MKKNNVIYYPAIFHVDEKSGYWVSFPDIEGCFTQGENMEEAYGMAVDALSLMLAEYVDNKCDLPRASLPQDISVDAKSGEFIVVVGFDVLEYKKRHNNKAVKKTLSIPEWLNELAVGEGVNFSQILQEALIQRLT